MHTILFAILMGLTLFGTCAPAAHAQDDRVHFGGDVRVRPGETVHDVVTMGGDARIEGRVTGDVHTMGGDIDVREGAVVEGDVGSMGGDLRIREGAVVHGDLESMGGEIRVEDGAVVEGAVTENAGSVHMPPVAPSVPGIPHVHAGLGIGDVIGNFFGSLASYALLFVLGLLLMGVTPERYEAMQVAIVRQPLRSLGLGLLGTIGAIVSIVVLAITIIGIPAAVLLAIALPFAIYVGMAAFASVLGTLLPVESLRGKPVLRLGAGVLALFVASLVPFAGSIAVAVAAVVGVGALVITRFRKTVEVERERVAADGPYRASAAEQL
jgi:hypothetical protein